MDLYMTTSTKYICTDNTNHEEDLTVGKIYEAHRMTDGDDSAYLIIVDSGKPCVFQEVPKELFQLLEEYRDEQLKKLDI